jgi:hypothetical protein
MIPAMTGTHTHTKRGLDAVAWMVAVEPDREPAEARLARHVGADLARLLVWALADRTTRRPVRRAS